MEAIIPLLLFLAIFVIWLIARGMDTDRVKEYIEARGGKLLEKHWAPFGKGWFGEKSDRIYEVRYLDKNGNEHQASCKTSLWSGVYWTEDTIVKYARRAEEDSPSVASLEEENRRLRQENERLRRGEA
jgi:hypothetical protein